MEVNDNITNQFLAKFRPVFKKELFLAQILTELERFENRENLWKFWEIWGILSWCIKSGCFNLTKSGNPLFWVRLSKFSFGSAENNCKQSGGTELTRIPQGRIFEIKNVNSPRSGGKKFQKIPQYYKNSPRSGGKMLWLFKFFSIFSVLKVLSLKNP